MIKSLIRKGYISSKFVIPLDVLVAQTDETQPVTYQDILEESKNALFNSSTSPARASFIKLKAQDFTTFTMDLENENPLLGLKNALQMHRKNISLKGTETILLNSLIDFLLEYYENQRSLDYYAETCRQYLKTKDSSNKRNSLGFAYDPAGFIYLLINLFIYMNIINMFIKLRIL